MRADVRQWFDRRTSHAADWPVEHLLAAKGDHRVSVVLPALDEAPTVGGVVSALRPLLDPLGLVDEVVVMDSGSTDGTADVAAAAGATVRVAAEVLPHLGPAVGKGDTMWRSLLVTAGDVVVFVDADLLDVDPAYVTGLLGPLLTDPTVALVKALYDRPLMDAGSVAVSGGGRVTELVARPLLNAHWPGLAGVVQPLAGEYAARRDVLEALPFPGGYGVELGLLVDVAGIHGRDAIAQVDLGRRVHGHQSDLALGRMAGELLHTALARLATQRRVPWSAPPAATPSQFLTQFHRDAVGSGWAAETADVHRVERPAMRGMDEYLTRAGAVGR